MPAERQRSKSSSARSGLNTPQIHGLARVTAAFLRPRLPFLTSSVMWRTRLKETNPWPHIVVISSISGGGR